MKREKVTFKNSRGLILSGAIELPENNSPKAFAIFSHCFTCNKNLINVKYISEALSEKRIAVLRFDFAGLGDSQGNFAETDFSSNIDDLLYAAEFLTLNYEVAYPDSISFYYKVSSETNYDFLRFSINSLLKDEWSGNQVTNWRRAAYYVEAGEKLFKWEYTKDYSVSTDTILSYKEYETNEKILGQKCKIIEWQGKYFYNIFYI